MFNDLAENPWILAALHFELEKRPLEEVLMRVKKHSESLERELSGQKIFSIFDICKSKNAKGIKLRLSHLLNMEMWEMFPTEMKILGQNTMLESIARCSRRQIHGIQIQDQTVISHDLFGAQFHPGTSFFIVTFIHNNRASFVVTANEI